MMIDYSVVLYFILGGYLLAWIAGLVGGILLLRLTVRWSVRGIKALRARAHRQASTKEKIVRMDGPKVRADEEMLTTHLGLGAVQAWARRALSRERLAAAGVVVATFVVTGYVGAVLYHVTHTEWVRGF